MLVFIYLLKVVISFLYAYIHYENGWHDTFVFFRSGKQAAQLFPQHLPEYIQFITGQLPKSYSSDIAEIVGQQQIAYYKLPRSSFIVQLHALLIPLSFGFYTVQCILFEFLSFIGIIYIYYFFRKNFNKNDVFIKFFLFFTPSLLFWYSGMHKDSLTLFGLGITLYSFSHILKKKWQYGIAFIGSFFFLYATRDYAALLLFPALVSLGMAYSMKKKQWLPYLIVYSVSILFFFTSFTFFPSINFPQKFIDYQLAFKNLEGSSSMSTEVLQPTFFSFIKYLPKAISRSVFTPNFTFVHSPLLSFAAVENYMLLFIGAVLLTVSTFKSFSPKQKAILYFLSIYGFSYFIMLGYVVNNVGAMTRYRVTGLLFVGIALITIADINRLNQFFKSIFTTNKLTENVN